MKFKCSSKSEHDGPWIPGSDGNRLSRSMADDRVQLEATFEMNVMKVLIERKIFRES